MLEWTLCYQLALVLGIVLAAGLVLGAVRLPAMFSDHMVLQRQMPLPIWGMAKPGEQVTVGLGDQRAIAQADEKGFWMVHLDALEAGGPHELCVKGQEGPCVTVRDVWAGEVWLCSGQSNMEFHVSQAANAETEMAQSHFPSLRYISVPRNPSAVPQPDVAAQWAVCTPETIGECSAVAYFFGRHLHRMLEMPVGLIVSAVGGTLVEAWTSRGGLETLGEVAQPILDRLDRTAADYPRLRKEYEEAFQRWQDEAYHKDPGNQGVELGWAKPDFEDGDWADMKLPQFWEQTGLNIDGSVWFRKEVEVPLAWAGKDLVLQLGPVDDFDNTYFNGTRIGGIGRENPTAYCTPRVYTVPGALVKAGKNTIAVRVFDQFGNGGFGGVSSQMKLGLPDGAPGEAIGLAAIWRYKVELALEPIKVLPPGPVEPLHPGALHAPGALFNGMIQPLAPYGIRGAIWYQGESNCDRAEQYRTLFPAMIKDWRRAWGQGDFPFLFVQLANFMERAAQPGESDWAELREAQLMTLSAPRTGMAVAVDIGEALDIHPKNKQDVGKRLALAAAATVYERDCMHAGPIYDSMKIEGDSIRLSFRHVGGGLVAHNGKLEGFAIAGADRKFVWADACIDGDSVVVSAPGQVKRPVAVRYGWASNPASSLYNREGLPASPFRTDDWPGVTVGRR